MSEQDNSARAEEREASESGLLLSIDPIDEGMKYVAKTEDDSNEDTDMGDGEDADDSDDSDTDDADDDGNDGGGILTDSDSSDSDSDNSDS